MKTITIFTLKNFEKFENKTRYALRDFQRRKDLGDYATSLSSEVKLIQASKMVLELNQNDLYNTIQHLGDAISQDEGSIATKLEEIAKAKERIKDRQEVLSIAKSSKSYIDFFKKISKQ